MRRILELHRDDACEAVARLEVEVARPAAGQLALRYRLSGETAGLYLPTPGEVERADELWRRTCFEAFVGQAAGADYFEVNLAPSRQWAVYGFAGYRDSMRTADEVPTPVFETTRDAHRYELAANLDLSLTSLPPAGTWRLAISAVIEDAAGAKSHWALAHPPGKPDFHHPEGFVLDLTAEAP